jgi:hypothetical protein
MEFYLGIKSDRLSEKDTNPVYEYKSKQKVAEFSIFYGIIAVIIKLGIKIGNENKWDLTHNKKNCDNRLVY